jgi:hypothetical protein
LLCGFFLGCQVVRLGTIKGSEHQQQTQYEHHASPLPSPAGVVVLKLNFAAGTCLGTGQNGADIVFVYFEDHRRLPALFVFIAHGEKMLAFFGKQEQRPRPLRDSAYRPFAHTRSVDFVVGHPPARVLGIEDEIFGVHGLHVSLAAGGNLKDDAADIFGLASVAADQKHESGSFRVS